MRSSFVSVFFAGLLLPFTLAAPAVGAAVERDVATIRTPHGERPVANVHEVPEGGHVLHVGDEIHLVDGSGNVVHVAPNDGSTIRTPSTTTNASRPEQSGWIANANWYNTGSSPINSFTTTWTVPKAPSTYHSQTIFLFNAIEPASGNAILQPVLQYGPSAAGGGKYWAVASWYLVGSQTYYTKLVKVNAGKSLKGVMTLKSSSGSKYNYVSSFTNVAGTSLTAKNSAVLVWATETLESYGVSKRSDYPAGSTVFSGITIRTKAGTPKVTWQAVSDKKDGITTKINTQGATNAKVTITY